MKEQVRIKVTGTDAAKETIRTEYAGELIYKEPYYYVSYNERLDPDSEEESHTVLKFNDRFLRLTRRGLVESVLEYEEGRWFTGVYNTPFVTFDVSLFTEELCVIETEQEIRLQAHYRMGFNEAPSEGGALQIQICRS